jgi:hypothetical protein
MANRTHGEWILGITQMFDADLDQEQLNWLGAAVHEALVEVARTARKEMIDRCASEIAGHVKHYRELAKYADWEDRHADAAEALEELAADFLAWKAADHG